MPATRQDRAGRPPRGGRRANAHRDAAAGQMAVAHGGAAGVAAGGMQHRVVRRPTGRPRRRHGRQRSSPAGAAPAASILPPTQPPPLCSRGPPPRPVRPRVGIVYAPDGVAAASGPLHEAAARAPAAASAPTATSPTPRRPTAPSFLLRAAAAASAAPAPPTPLRLPIEGGPWGAGAVTVLAPATQRGRKRPATKRRDWKWVGASWHTDWPGGPAGGRSLDGAPSAWRGRPAPAIQCDSDPQTRDRRCA